MGETPEFEQGAPAENIDDFRDSLHARIVGLRKHPKAATIGEHWFDAVSSLAQTQRDQFGLDSVELVINRVAGQLAGKDPQEGMDESRKRIALLIEELRKRPGVSAALLDGHEQSLLPEANTDKYYLDFIEKSLNRIKAGKQI